MVQPGHTGEDWWRTLQLEWSTDGGRFGRDAGHRRRDSRQRIWRLAPDAALEATADSNEKPRPCASRRSRFDHRDGLALHLER